jgi:hypothetical protein
MPDEVHPQRTQPFKLVFEDHPEYFFACVEAGTVTDELTLEYNAAIAAEISKRQYDRVMIKRDVPLRNNTGEHCSLIYMVRGWSVRRIKYAFVDVKPEHVNFYKFALIYANGKGIEAEVFADIDLAKTWLLC